MSETNTIQHEAPKGGAERLLHHDVTLQLNNAHTRSWAGFVESWKGNGSNALRHVLRSFMTNIAQNRRVFTISGNPPRSILPGVDPHLLAYWASRWGRSLPDQQYPWSIHTVAHAECTEIAVFATGEHSSCMQKI